MISKINIELKKIATNPIIKWDTEKNNSQYKNLKWLKDNKLINILSHHGKAIENNTEILLHRPQLLYPKTPMTVYTGEDMEKGDYSSIAGGNANL